MTKTQSPSKKQTPIWTFLIIFLCGFLSGVGLAVYKLNPSDGSSTAANSKQSDAHIRANHEAINNLEAEVTANPENFQAWIQLGHLYFDSEQPEKAIEAYTTSLKYHSGDANLLTDLGVMYRRMDHPQNALESFDKARAMDQTHQQSRFNKGIVLYYDLGDTAGAIESWEELLKFNPDAQAGNGQKIRDFVDQIKKDFHL